MHLEFIKIIQKIFFKFTSVKFGDLESQEYLNAI